MSRHAKTQSNESSNLLNNISAPNPLKGTLVFDSLSEYACVSMLEKYTNWRAVEGVTFHVPIGKHNFDFLIYDTLVEFHPIVLKREMITKKLADLLSLTATLSKEKQTGILSIITLELAAQYDKRRKQLVRSSQIHGDTPVICVFSDEQFIDKILLKFSNKKDLDKKRLLGEFKWYKENIK